jgi:glycosyltransferase involved in cell wall biosynthesis
MKAAEADHAYQLSKHLADYGFDVAVLTTNENARCADRRIALYPLMRRWSWSELPTFARFIWRCSPDVVLLNYIGWIYNDHPMITFAPTISKAILPRVRFVTMIENVLGSDPLQTRFWERAVRKALVLWTGRTNVHYNFGSLLHLSDTLIFLSDSHRDHMAKLVAGIVDKSVLIPPPPFMQISGDKAGKTRSRGRQALGVVENEFLLVYFGRIYPGKGIETLLMAFRSVAVRRHNLRLIFVGGTSESIIEDRPKYLEELQQLTNDLGIDDKVLWTGEFSSDSEEASIYLRAADICVLPFDYGVHLNNSSFSSVAAHGLPTITTQGTVLESAFRHGENVFLCPPRNPEALRLAIETLLDQPDVRSRLRCGALKLHDEYFSWEKAVEHTVRTFF